MSIILRDAEASVILRKDMSGAIVTPLTTTVTATTTTVIATTVDGWSRQSSETTPSSRCHERPHMSWSYMVCWMVRASARPTEPRSPPHHITTASRHVTEVPRRRSSG